MGRWSLKSAHLRLRSVREDWQAWLPAEKDRLFDVTVGELETSYAMLSITLDEAFGLRSKGYLMCAREQTRVCGELFQRLATPLLTVLRALEEHGRNFGTLPGVAPLNPQFFRGETAQRMAWRNNLFSKVLLSMRSRFFHKLHDLAETIEELVGEFHQASEEIAAGSSVQPVAHWQALDILHYDLNTCLRETTVLLKSFLCALPNEQVQPFAYKLRAVSLLPPPRVPVPAVRR